MKILHVVPTYIPAFRYGGPIYAVHGLCRGLVAHGHDVHVFTTNVDGDRDSEVPLDGPVMMDGVSVRYFRSSIMRRLYWSPPMARALREEISEFDIVHLHSVFLWPTRAAAVVAHREGVPYVVSPRGMLVRDLIRRRSRWVKTAWITLVERGNLSRAAAIHFTSRVEWDEASELGLTLPRPFVVSNGVEPVADDHRQRPVGNGPLLFLGRVNWKKGLDRLIESMALVPGCRLVVAGNDEEEYTPVLKSLAVRLGVSDRVDFVGQVSGTRKAELLANAAALVLPSYSENFGNVVLEAMAAGTPVIVTPEVGAAEIVERTDAGIVTSGDPEHLSAALNRLLDQPELGREMGQRGMRAVEANYSWNSIAFEMIGKYQEILGA